MDDIRDFTSEATKAVEAAIEAAYKRGYDDGKKVGEQEAASGLKARLATLFEEGPVTNVPLTVPSKEYTDLNNLFTVSGKDGTSHERAAPGTVKPVILSIIANSSSGVTTRDIEKATGIKYNSVRGTVWLLHKEHAISKDDRGRWTAVPAVKEAAKKQALDNYLEEIKLAEEAAKKDEAPPGDPESASRETGGVATP